MKIGAIRAAVMDRARGRCEACGERAALALDHWLGGIGRRRQMESVETTWALCGECHRDRTENRPSAADWNRHFEAHARRHGYPVVLHLHR